MRRTAAALLVAAMAWWCQAAPFAQQSLEYEVKTQFLYNFFNFVEWPSGAFAQSDSPFRLCLVGDDPFGPLLDALVKGQAVSGHRIVIDRLVENPGIGGCHALFISHVDDARLAAIMNAAAHQSILIVGESRRVLELCGGIAFVVDGERVRFDINVSALASRRLKASSKLLRLAREASDRFAHCL
ncbi:MAG: YfiR family protein [Acidobacteriota bacterium]